MIQKRIKAKGIGEDQNLVGESLDLTLDTKKNTNNTRAYIAS